MSTEIARGSVGLQIDRGLFEKDVLGATSGAAEKAGAAFSSKFSGLIGKLGSAGTNLGLPFTGALTQMSAKMGQTEAATGGLMAKLGTAAVPAAALAVGLTAVGVEAFKLGTEMQQTTARIASNAGVTVDAAKKITDAFLDTAGKSIFSGQQMGQAFAAVAAPLGEMAGHALSARQALDFMRTSSDLAEASNTDLGTSTSTLSRIMQQFQVPLSGASKAADTLFSTSRLTGVGIDQLGNTMARLQSRLGVTSGGLQQLGGLLVDLQEHGVVGSRGLMVVNSAINTLISNATKAPVAMTKAVGSAQTTLTAAADALAKAQERLAQVQGTTGTGASTALAKAQEHLVQVQSQLAGAGTAKVTAAQDALAKAQQRLRQEEERLAGVRTLSVSQSISLANAQQAVTDASTTLAGVQATAEKPSTALANAQAAVAAAEAKTASLSPSVKSAQEAVAAATAKHTAAVAALQAAQAGLSPKLSTSVTALESLGLHVYNAQGAFVGMRDIIAQLQPKLEAMTQAQQLQTLGAVFGNNANKALLSTVLAGPAAYDQAVAKVTQLNAVHLAAEKQSQTFDRQMQVLKATAIDLGTKLGELLIPVVVKVGEVIAKVTEFFLKHKAVAIALGIVLADVLTGGISTVIIAAVALAKNWDTVWNGIKSVFDTVWHAIQTGIRAVVDTFLGMVKTIIDGAAHAFGWVPIIGGKLKDAAKGFDEFKLHVDSALGSVSAGLALTAQAMVAFNKQAAQTGSAVRELPTGQFVAAGGQHMMAVGGVVTRRISNVTLGESGPEAVVPLTNPAAAARVWAQASMAGYSASIGTGGPGTAPAVTIQHLEINSMQPERSATDLVRSLRSQLFLLGLG